MDQYICHVSGIVFAPAPSNFLPIIIKDAEEAAKILLDHSSESHAKKVAETFLIGPDGLSNDDPRIQVAALQAIESIAIDFRGERLRTAFDEFEKGAKENPQAREVIEEAKKSSSI